MLQEPDQPGRRKHGRHSALSKIDSMIGLDYEPLFAGGADLGASLHPSFLRAAGGRDLAERLISARRSPLANKAHRTAPLQRHRRDESLLSPWPPTLPRSRRPRPPPR